MRADNHGEGGILALIALVMRARERSRGGQARARRARHLRRRAALRRRHDHAGHLGAVRRRGPRGRDARLRPLGRPDRAGDPDRAVRDPATRHRPRRRAVRAGDGRLVRGDRRARRPSRSSTTRACCARCRPTYAVEFFVNEPRDRVPRPRRGLPGGHRRRGAVRRHGPLRPAADPPRVVRARAARRCCSTTSGQGALVLPRPGGRRQPVLPRWRPTCAAAAGGAGHDRHRHRVAGAHLRRVLAHPPGRAARLPAAPAHPAHLAKRDRAGLRPGRELDADTWRVVASCSASASSTNLAAAYGIAVTGTMAITRSCSSSSCALLWNKPRWLGDQRRDRVPDRRPRLLRGQHPEDPRTAAGSRSRSPRWRSRR